MAWEIQQVYQLQNLGVIFLMTTVEDYYDRFSHILSPFSATIPYGVQLATIFVENLS